MRTTKSPASSKAKAALLGLSGLAISAFAATVPTPPEIAPENILSGGTAEAPVSVTTAPTVSTEYAGYYNLQLTGSKANVAMVFSGRSTIGGTSADTPFELLDSAGSLWVTGGTLTAGTRLRDSSSGAVWNILGGRFIAAENGGFRNANYGTAVNVNHNFYGGYTEMPITFAGTNHTHPNWNFNVYNNGEYYPREIKTYATSNPTVTDYKVSLHVYGGTLYLPPGTLTTYARLFGEADPDGDSYVGHVVAREGNVSISAPVTLNAGAVTSFGTYAGTDYTIAISSSITGSGNIVVESGTLNLDGAALSGWTGTITVKSGAKLISALGAIDSSRLTVEEGGTYAYTSITVSGEVAADVVSGYVESAKAAGLTELVFHVAADNEATISSQINLYDGMLVKKTGAGILRLTGDNYWTGDTVIEGGALVARDGKGLPAASKLVLKGGAFSPIQSEGEEFTRVEGTGWSRDSSTSLYAFTAIDNPVVLNFGGAAANWTPSEQWKTLSFNRVAAEHTLTLKNPLAMKGLTIVGGPTEATAAYLAGGIPSNNGNSETFSDGYVYITTFVTSGNKLNMSGNANVTITGTGSVIRDQQFIGPATGGTATLTFAPGSTATVDGSASGTFIGGNSDNTDYTSTGIMNVAGTVTANAGNTTLGRNTKGTGYLNVNEGGNYIAKYIARGSGTGYVTLDGGTITAGSNASENWIMNLSGFIVGPKGGTIDTQNKSVYINASPSGLGKMTKTGSGLLTVSSLAYQGGLDVSNGTLKVKSGSAGTVKLYGRSLAHRYAFNGDLKDEVTGTLLTGVDGDSSHKVTINGDNVYLGGSGTYGNGAHLVFPANFVPRADAATIEMWITSTWISGSNNADIFSVGSGTANCLRLTLPKGGGKPFLILNGTTYQATGSDTIEAMSYNTSSPVQYYICMTIADNGDGTSTIVVRLRDWSGNDKGKLAVTPNWTLSGVSQTTGYLNGSFNTGIAKASIGYHELRVWNGLLSEDQIAASVSAGADSVAEVKFDDLPADAVFTLASGATLQLEEGATIAENFKLEVGAKITAVSNLDISGCTFVIDADSVAENLGKCEGHQWVIASVSGSSETPGVATGTDALKAALSAVRLHFYSVTDDETGTTTLCAKRTGFIVTIR